MVRSQPPGRLAKETFEVFAEPARIDEIFRAYDNQAGHMMIFIAQLGKLLVVHLV